MTSERRRVQPRKQPRQARAEQTRERILEAAAHVFADHGYAAGTTNRIAERARVSIGSLYQYYPNKDAILAELLSRHLDTGVADAEWHLNLELSLPLEDLLRGAVRATIGNHRDDPQLLRIMAEQAPRRPELIEKVSRHERERTAVARRLVQHHPEVRVGNTDVAARLIVSTVELVIHRLIASPDPVGHQELEDELVAMLTRYLTAAPPDPDPDPAGPARPSPRTS